MRLAAMFRSFNMLMLVILIAIVAWTFKVKHDSRAAHDRVSELERQIEAQEVEIDLFKSDWSLLTSPARLEKLVERYGDQLELEEMTPSQMADQDSMPPLKSELPVEQPESGADFAGMGQQTTASGLVAIPADVRRAE